MTNEEAKEKLYMQWQEFLEENIDYAGISDAYKMALEDLSHPQISEEAYKQVMWERDIAIKQLNDLGYEFGEKIEPQGDTISRQAVLDYIHRILSQGTGKKKSFEFIQKYVEKLPPVTPQPKTGYWRETDTNQYACSECNHCFSIIPEDNAIEDISVAQIAEQRWLNHRKGVRNDKRAER